MENFWMNAGSKNDVANTCPAQALFTVEMLMSVDHIVLDASTLLEHQYVDEEGRVHGIDTAPFWQLIHRSAASTQAFRYPNGEDRLLQIPESCVVEITKKADNADGSVPGHLVKAAQKAMERLHVLLHELRVLKVIPDDAQGCFGDSAILAVALRANSRQKLLFIVQDRVLGCDLLRLCAAESSGSGHDVCSFDRHGFLCPLPSDGVTQQSDADLQTAPVC